MNNAPSRILAIYLVTGLLFMLVPGTFLGVWNLLQVSEREGVGLVSQSWLQAHGHAQIFGWIGTFILGIGFFSLHDPHSGSRPASRAARVCWVVWTTGVAMRWATNVYGGPWRVMLPVSALLELTAFSIFFRMVSRHRPAAGDIARTQATADLVSSRITPWIGVVMTASIGFVLTLLANAGACFYLAWRGESPAVPHALNQRFLVLAAWGFLAPFVWGFSLKWLPRFVGLRPARTRLVAAAVTANLTGVLLTLAGLGNAATVLFLGASLLIVLAIRVFEPAGQSSAAGRIASFPLFVRLAYAWLIVAAVLGVAAAIWDRSGGIWGGSRHAFTVGFISTMVFCIGQRVLPAFAGFRPLWSPRLMLVSVVLLAAGCALRVGSEILAYQRYAAWAWSILPVSAGIEMTAFSCFALNMAVTILVEPEPSAAGTGYAAASRLS